MPAKSSRRSKPTKPSWISRPLLSGVLRKILVHDGETVQSGTLIAVIAEADEDIADGIDRRRHSRSIRRDRSQACSPPQRRMFRAPASDPAGGHV